MKVKIRLSPVQILQAVASLKGGADSYFVLMKAGNIATLQNSEGAD